MKKKTAVLLFILLTIFAIPFAFADSSQGSSSQGNVTKVYAGYTNGSVYVRGLDNAAVCASSTIRFTPSNSNQDAIYKLAMTSMNTGIPLLCQVDGCIGSYQKGLSCVIQN